MFESADYEKGIITKPDFQEREWRTLMESRCSALLRSRGVSFSLSGNRRRGIETALMMEGGGYSIVVGSKAGCRKGANVTEIEVEGRVEDLRRDDRAQLASGIPW